VTTEAIYILQIEEKRNTELHREKTQRFTEAGMLSFLCETPCFSV